MIPKNWLTILFLNTASNSLVAVFTMNTNFSLMKKSIKCEARTLPQQLFQSVELSHEKKMALSILFNHIDHDIQ